MNTAEMHSGAMSLLARHRDDVDGGYSALQEFSAWVAEVPSNTRREFYKNYLYDLDHASKEEWAIVVNSLREAQLNDVADEALSALERISDFERRQELIWVLTRMKTPGVELIAYDEAANMLSKRKLQSAKLIAALAVFGSDAAIDLATRYFLQFPVQFPGALGYVPSFWHQYTSAQRRQLLGQLSAIDPVKAEIIANEFKMLEARARELPRT